MDSFPDWLELIADSLKPAKVIGVDPLRKWSLSQVFRLTLDDEGRTLIAKRGIPTKGPTELEIYQECLIPLAIDTPTVFASYASDSEYILLIEDLRGTDLEQQPSKSTFLDAARKLADIRASADRIGKISASNLQKHLLTKNQLLLDFDYVTEHAGSEHRDALGGTYQLILKTFGPIISRGSSHTEPQRLSRQESPTCQRTHCSRRLGKCAYQSAPRRSLLPD